MTDLVISITPLRWHLPTYERYPTSRAWRIGPLHLWYKVWGKRKETT